MRAYDHRASTGAARAAEYAYPGRSAPAGTVSAGPGENKASVCVGASSPRRSDDGRPVSVHAMKATEKTRPVGGSVLQVAGVPLSGTPRSSRGANGDAGDAYAAALSLTHVRGTIQAAPPALVLRAKGTPWPRATPQAAPTLSAWNAHTSANKTSGSEAWTMNTVPATEGWEGSEAAGDDPSAPTPFKLTRSPASHVVLTSDHPRTLFRSPGGTPPTAPRDKSVRLAA